jgi:hypothetical protein
MAIARSGCACNLTGGLRCFDPFLAQNGLAEKMGGDGAREKRGAFAFPASEGVETETPSPLRIVFLLAARAKRSRVHEFVSTALAPSRLRGSARQIPFNPRPKIDRIFS